MSVALNNELLVHDKDGLFTVALDRSRRSTHQYAVMVAVAAIPQTGDVEVAAINNLVDIFPVDKFAGAESLKKQVIRCIVNNLAGPLLRTAVDSLGISPTELVGELSQYLFSDNNLVAHTYQVNSSSPAESPKS
jgi:hypothetical protein